MDKNKGEAGILSLFYKLFSSVLMHFFLLKGLHHNADYLNIYEEGFTVFYEVIVSYVFPFGASIIIVYTGTYIAEFAAAGLLFQSH